MTKEMSVGAIERMCSVDKKVKVLQKDMRNCISKYLPVGQTITLHSRVLDQTIYGQVSQAWDFNSVEIEVLTVDGKTYKAEHSRLVVQPFNRTEYELIKIGD